MATTPTVWLNERQANTTDAGAGGDDQTQPKIIALADGSFVTLWRSNTDLGAGADAGAQIIAQRYDAEGAPLGTESLAAFTSPMSPQGEFDAAATPDGGYVVVFEQTGPGGASIAFTYHREADGAPFVYSIPLEDPGVDAIGGPSVSVTQNGGFLIAYQSRDLDGGQGTSTWGLLVSSELEYGDPFLLIPDSFADDVGAGGHKVVTATLADGNYVVVSRAPGADDALAMTVVNPTGGEVLAPTYVANTDGNGDGDLQPSVTALTGGGFVVAWRNADGGDLDVEFQIYDAAGTEVGGVHTVNSGGTTDANIMPDVVGLADGGFVIVHDDNEDGTLKLQRYDGAGAELGDEVQVTVFSEELDPVVTLAGDGRLLIGWTRRVPDGGGGFDNDIAFEIWDPRDDSIFGTAASELITARREGGYVAARAGDDTLLGEEARDNLVGEGGDDLVLGRDEADTLSGQGGHDTIQGGEGDDFLMGFDIVFVGSGMEDADTVQGGAGDDTIRGSYGGDLIEGGRGRDRVFGYDGDDLIFAASGGSRLAPDGGGEIDAGEGDDTVFGAGGADTLLGGAGADVIEAAGGQDSVNGGAEADRIDGGGDNDTLAGGAGDDTLEGGALSDSLLGGVHHDRIDGGSEDDVLKGEDGADTLNGGADADSVLGGFGDDVVVDADGLSADTLNGGNGLDTLDYSMVAFVDGAVTIDLRNGMVTAAGAPQFDEVHGFETVIGSAGSERIFGTGASERLEGFNGDDTLLGGSGLDTLLGQAGNDALIGGDLDNLIEGGGEDDTLFGNGGIDSLSGGDGDDVLDGGERGDDIDGGGGIDTAFYGTSAAAVNVNLFVGGGLGGNAEDDLLFDVENVIGSDFDDSLTGSRKDNLLVGGDGNDTVDGADKSDTLDGGAGLDQLFGGNNGDLLGGGDGEDTLDGNAGSDTVLGGAESDLLFGNDGDDSIEGGEGEDELNGARGRDYLGGGDGGDDLAGHENSDTLDGGAGADTLNGGINKDSLTGGTGADLFLFKSLDDSTATQGSRDQILDFSHAEGDKIDVSRLDADTTQGGNQAFLFVADFTGAAGELRVKDLGGGQYQVQADIDGDEAADFAIDVTSATALVAADFTL